MQVTLDRETISTLLGYSSILAWLGAQLPQLVENWRNGSVEGLALPFLVSWLAGDATNLLGCVLTHQLPFQTYLAIYFVLVDVGLMSQYIYYARRNAIPEIPALTHAARRAHRSAHPEAWVSERTRSKKRRSRASGGVRTGGGEDPMERSWMSESSAAHSPASSRPHTTSHSRQHSYPVTSGSESTSPSTSTHTERGRTLSRPARTNVFGGPLETISGSPASASPGPYGFPLGLGQPDGGLESFHVTQHRNTSSTSRSRPPPAARRSSSMVFLSVGALVGFGRWSMGGNSPVGTGAARAWSTGDMTFSPPSLSAGPLHSGDWSRTHLQHPVIFSSSPFSSVSSHRHSKRQVDLLDAPLPPLAQPTDGGSSSSRPAKHGDQEDHKPSEDDKDDYPYPHRDLERFIGRASAWICTTLYLTSRLPQIWQNFRRRSVEGLAMMLFVMAFVGNSLYVLSILTNPLATQPGYLLESTPYLLGSGGTLCFDITIVLQSILYSEKRKARQERDRRRSGRFVESEEAAALLDEDRTVDEEDDDEEPTTGDESTTPRRRSRSFSQGRRGRSTSSGRALVHGRSESTELTPKASAGPYHHEHGAGDSSTPLEGRVFEFGRPASVSFDSEELSPKAPVSRSMSRGGRSRTTSAEPHVPAIEEEGESSVTIRP